MNTEKSSGSVSSDESSSFIGSSDGSSHSSSSSYSSGPSSSIVNPFKKVFITYSWVDEPDLDTITAALGEAIGWPDVASTEYMTFSGDDTALGGEEVVVIDLPQAWEDGVIPDVDGQGTVVITCIADWYSEADRDPDDSINPDPGSGPADLFFQYGEDDLGDSFVIGPGLADHSDSYTGTLVKTFTIREDGTIEIS